MYWILLVMGFMVAIVAALVIGGLATPRAHAASRSTTFRASPEQVWAVIRDVGAYHTWRDDMIDVEVVASGSQWREITSSGSVLFGIVEDQPQQRLVARILDEDLPWGGTWTWELHGVDNATRLTITEDGYVNNPIFRFIGTHFIGFTGTIDKYLRALARRLGEDAYVIS